MPWGEVLGPTESPGGGGAGTVTSVTATDASIVVSGTAAAPTIATGPLSTIATLHAPSADWSNNSHKITSLANGTLATDAAAFGQITAAAVSPLTTKGDIWGFDTGNNRVPIGSNNQVLTADSTQALGLKWAGVANSIVAGTGISVSGATGNVTITNTGLTSSPLTTKGDLWGFDTGQNRVPVGTNGFVLMADSAQTLGVGYSTRAANFNAQQVVNTTGVLVNESSSSNTPGVEIVDTATYTSGPTYYGIFINTAPTFNTTNLNANSAWLRVGGTWTVNAISGIGTLNALLMNPQLGGSAAPATFNGLNVSPQYNGSSTITTMKAMTFNPGVGGGATVTTLICCGISNTNSGTITTTVGLDIGNLAALNGSTIWGVRVGNYNSFWNGLTTFGNTSAPTYAIHLRGGSGATVNSATNAFGADASTTGPTAPASSAGWAISCYSGSGGTNKYFLITYNDAGTTRYKYLQLNGTGVTWATGTSLPT